MPASPPPAAIYLATPCYGGMAHAVFMEGLLALGPACAARGVGLQTQLGGGEALISRARGGMMAAFLASDATHLLFVDADIGFDPTSVFRLLDANLPVVGGLYSRKSAAWDGERAAAALRDEFAGAAGQFEMEPLPDGAVIARDGFRQVASVGTGFLLIDRSAAQRLTDAYPELRAKMGDVHDAFAPSAVMVFDSFLEPGTGRYLADHQAFCRRWRDQGGEVWADTQSRLSHVGQLVYKAG